MTSSTPNNAKTLQDDLKTWTDEAAALLELGRNAERTGVPADARTKERARNLLGSLQQALVGMNGSEPARAEERVLSENRILKAQLVALHEEAKLGFDRLHA